MFGCGRSGTGGNGVPAATTSILNRTAVQRRHSPCNPRWRFAEPLFGGILQKNDKRDPQYLSASCERTNSAGACRSGTIQDDVTLFAGRFGLYTVGAVASDLDKVGQF